MSQERLEHIAIPTALGELHVRVGGQGPAILFWPSLLMDGTMWQGVADRLMSRYQVVLIDPPGHGDSSALSRHFDFTTCANCIVQILDSLGIRNAHYVGNSWGAMIGGTFAALYPDRVGVAVLMNGTASPCGPGQRLQFQLMVQLGRLLHGIRGPLRASAVAAFLGPTSLRDRPQVAAGVRAALARIDFRSARWAVESVVLRRPAQHELLSTIRTPVMVVAGAEDATFPVAETQAMAQAIPGSSFVVMQGAAHLAGLECPGEASEMIESFIRIHG
ncbi:alpha/beta hydrolase [Pseudomonas aeruginosa]|uniref:alpha/beta fold hydrolase n=1 Tax=Pseudomonas aeruginosa group TaxID=136841 RepID=UPI0004EF97AD|nr:MULTISPECIES: alpha/beta hydrolase [Pseudomonas aeruginosa group]MBG5397662.1 alpha/beta fold hydrolase [Pseudomonas aeruginosa]MBH4354278.1 alpha/beta fold hydrolase [Pseudomonas aeruginosa]MBX6109651.1 alpha/beta fold hydrolase [Pseudomonas aeruginosa]MCS8144449.1 alpha/beta hydrolase [Pseudomonas aeruginosa]MDS9599533.1 alpha/beta hydrolase [Pseudomonas aeruginosa]